MDKKYNIYEGTFYAIPIRILCAPADPTLPLEGFSLIFPSLANSYNFINFSSLEVIISTLANGL